jgi:hypothetical protein
VTATKGINFDRNIRLSWLDDTAMLVAEGLDRHATRERLHALLADEIPSAENRRKTAMVLGRIWSWSADEHRARHTEAVELVQKVESGDRVWLHYGMTLLTHPFFRSAARVIGQLGRQRDTVDRDLIRMRLIGEFGELGTLRESLNRVFFSLSDWGALARVNGTRGDWRPLEDSLQTGCADLQLWLLACALDASPKHDLLLQDLLRLPELFPFQLTVGLDTIRQSPMFNVQRQGNGWDMVSLARRT